MVMNIEQQRNQIPNPKCLYFFYCVELKNLFAV